MAFADHQLQTYSTGWTHHTSYTEPCCSGRKGSVWEYSPQSSLNTCHCDFRILLYNLSKVEQPRRMNHSDWVLLSLQEEYWIFVKEAHQCFETLLTIVEI